MKEKILYITLKKKWFDMILSGVKLEEYRDLVSRISGKPSYWQPRLIEKDKHGREQFKAFTHVVGRNGYQKDAPEFKAVIENIRVGQGKSDWGAVEGVNYFIIEIGDIVSCKNIKKS